ncbi:hypothetical protein BDU57DRAFT_597993 [Ampelomyces quisqualis]|uniref:Uncharacterized protein n=1 Tax=Ampelomyces quisqualis TaxID=50730 RepID=A0A6A5QDI7_AMPQU|nr:hypothetical protein BDU57DRAFT_597993 [Ampelomyces quisqualis]
MSSSSSLLRPSLMICHPTLHNPTPDNAATFLRWTKLHNRDLLDLPATSHGDKITRALRFAKANATGASGEYFYTILSTRGAVWHSPQYRARSTRLDLENTRVLGEGEEGVGCALGDMVWDICEAKFCIYEEVRSGGVGGAGHGYADHPRGGGEKWVVGVSLDGDEGEVERVWKELVVYVQRGVGEEGKVYSSLYKHGGKEAQPDKHPEIAGDRIGGGKWLVLVLIVDEKGDKGEGDIEGLVEDWGKDQGEGVTAGVWKEELDMF